MIINVKMNLFPKETILSSQPKKIIICNKKIDIRMELYSSFTYLNTLTSLCPAKGFL